MHIILPVVVVVLLHHLLCDEASDVLQPPGSVLNVHAVTHKCPVREENLPDGVCGVGDEDPDMVVHGGLCGGPEENQAIAVTGGAVVDAPKASVEVRGP